MNIKQYCIIFILFLADASLKCHNEQQPSCRVTVVSSIYKGTCFLRRFLENICSQTIFNQCELLLINANSPEKRAEESIIKEYMNIYPNIKYVDLSWDPGVYGVWNLGIFIAQGAYITNANIDDLRTPNCLEVQADYLDRHPDISLVYADFKYTDDPSSPIDKCSIIADVKHEPITNLKKALSQCIPGPQPMWRKDAHVKAGLFDARYLYSGDWEMWNRMVAVGLLFAQIPDFCSGVYYYNPEGLSTNQVPEKVARRELENKHIIQQYINMWQGA